MFAYSIIQQVGDIMFCEVFETREGRSQGVAAIEFNTEKDAERAVRVMNQYEMGLCVS
jgi:hypothetical protein